MKRTNCNGRSRFSSPIGATKVKVASRNNEKFGISHSTGDRKSEKPEKFTAGEKRNPTARKNLTSANGAKEETSRSVVFDATIDVEWTVGTAGTGKLRSDPSKKTKLSTWAIKGRGRSVDRHGNAVEAEEGEGKTTIEPGRKFPRRNGKVTPLVVVDAPVRPLSNKSDKKRMEIPARTIDHFPAGAPSGHPAEDLPLCLSSGERTEIDHSGDGNEECRPDVEVKESRRHEDGFETVREEPPADSRPRGPSQSTIRPTSAASHEESKFDSDRETNRPPPPPPSPPPAETKSSGDLSEAFRSLVSMRPPSRGDPARGSRSIVAAGVLTIGGMACLPLAEGLAVQSGADRAALDGHRGCLGRLYRRRSALCNPTEMIVSQEFRERAERRLNAGKSRIGKKLKHFVKSTLLTSYDVDLT